MVSMDIFWIVTAATLGLWLIAVVFQLGDLAAGWFDVLTARDQDEPSWFRRPGELFWALPVAALVALAIALGVDLAGRMMLDAGYPILGALVLLGLAVLMVLAALGALAALREPETMSYARLRQSLRAAKATKLSKGDVAVFRNELGAVDGRQGSIRLESRNRPRLHGMRRRLEQFAETLPPGAPTGSAIIRSVPWKFAFALLTRTNPWRLVPAGLGLLVLVTTWLAIIATGSGGVLGVAAVLLPVTSHLLAILNARFSLASKVAWHAVYQKQRAEAAQDLQELERRAGRGIPGLSDRVSRALRILREQQG